MTNATEPHPRNMHQRPVLVLNQNYEPLNVCTVRRALLLVLCGKAEILEEYQSQIMSYSRSFETPSVIRLIYMIRRPRPRVKLTRREIFLRDDHTCQYCGARAGDLTIDHIVPRSRGGLHTWENLVSACRVCNHRKGGKTVAEARMKLRCDPFEPRAGMYYTIQRRLNAAAHDGWHKFIPGFQAAPELHTYSTPSD